MTVKDITSDAADSRRCVDQNRNTESRRRRFLSDRDGNIAILFVFMSTMLFLFVGGAVDYSRWNAIRADMIESMDAASLAVAQLADSDDTLTKDELKLYGQRFFKENFNFESRLRPGWNINFNLDDDAVIATCVNGELDTLLLGVAGIHDLSIDKCVEITPQGSGRIELALVLDVTGSMDWNDSGGSHKMTSLKNAVTELLDVMFENDPTSQNVRIGVVPFNQHVNPGGASSWDGTWGDQNAAAAYHGARFFHVDETGTVVAARKVNHYDLYASDPDHTWQGCVEARPYPLDELDTPPGAASTAAFLTAQLATPNSTDEPDSDVRDAFSSKPDIDPSLTLATIAAEANSRWVPVFLADEPDCNSTNECAYATTGTFDGINWSGAWFTDPDSDPVLTWVQESAYRNAFYLGDRMTTNLAFGGEPFEKYVRVVHHFREVMDANIADAAFSDWLADMRVTSKEQEYIVRSGYVGWWNPLNSQYDFKYEFALNNSDGPNPDDCPDPIIPLSDTRSTIETAVNALQPDGGTNIPIGAVWGWRVVSPGVPFEEAIGPGEAGPGGTVFDDWQKAVVIMTDGNNDFSDRNVHWGSSPSAFGYEFEERMGDGVDEADQNGVPNMEDEADNKLLRICRRMKQDDILVYTIVFDVPAGGTIENIFKSCATEPTSPYFYNAPNGAQLEQAFGDIADDLVKLHISK